MIKQQTSNCNTTGYQVIHPGDFIRQSGWSYERAAEEFCVTTVTVWRWMKHKSKPHTRAFLDAHRLNQKYRII